MVGADTSSLMAVPAYPWIRQGTYDDVLFELSADEGIARISINRPEKRNAFRPRTVSELYDAFARVRDNPRIGVVLFTGAGPAADGAYAFCAGGDQSVRGDGGYLDEEGTPRLNVLDLQRLIRSLPKVVIALVVKVQVTPLSMLWMMQRRLLGTLSMMWRSLQRRLLGTMIKRVFDDIEIGF